MSDDLPAAVVVGRQQRFYELPAAAVGVLTWALILAFRGLVLAVECLWLSAIGIVLGLWVVRMRLLLNDSTLEYAIIGPWRRRVALEALESLNWKHVGGPASKGVIVVRDGNGGRMQIPVGRLSGIEVWGSALLQAAARHGAAVDPKARHLLEGAGAPTT